MLSIFISGVSTHLQGQILNSIREDARGGLINTPKFFLTKGKNFDFHNFSKFVVHLTSTPPEKNPNFLPEFYGVVECIKL